jgi:capsular exopolysaccharide synthesis family protein
MDEEQTSSAVLREYWRILRRRRWAVYSALALALLVAAAHAYLTTPVFRATTVVQIERLQPNVVDFQDVAPVDYSYLAYENFYQTQYSILATRDVARRTAEALDLPNRSLPTGGGPGLIRRVTGWLGGLLTPATEESPADAPVPDPLDPFADFVVGYLTIDPVRNSHLVNLSFDSPDPVLAMEVANAHAESYIAHNLESKYDTAKAASEFLDEQIVTLREEIAGLDATFQEYGLDQDSVSLTDRQQMIVASMSGVSERFTEAQLRRAAAEARLSALKDADPDSLQEVRESLLVRDLKARYADLDRQVAQMDERFGKQWPQLASVRAEMEQLQGRITTETDLIFHRVLRNAQVELTEARAEESALAVLLEDKKGQVQSLNRQSVEHESLQAEVEKQRALLDQLLERRSETIVSTHMTDSRTSNIRIVERASLPAGPIRPNVPRSLMLGLVLGLFAGVGAAFLLERVDNSIRTAEEVESLLGLRALASIGVFEAGRHADGPDSPDLVAWDAPRASQSEAYRNLRTALMLSGPSGPPRSIVLTSCHPEEGKTASALNLAVVLSQLGRSVLLVDADLRRPRLHKIVGVPATAGLSTYLSGNAPPTELVVATKVPGLSLIPAGPLPPNPSELLESEAFSQLVSELTSSDYDNVVIDSPPLLSVTDPQILGRLADATVLVLRSGVTPRDSARKAVERLRAARAHLVGVVLTQVSRTDARYYDYHYYQQRASDADEPAGPATRPERPERARARRE